MTGKQAKKIRDALELAQYMGEPVYLNPETYADFKTYCEKNPDFLTFTTLDYEKILKK